MPSGFGDVRCLPFSLVNLARSGIPLLISGMPGDMLTTFEHLSHFSNAMIALDPEEIAKELKLLAAKKRIKDAKVAVFTSDFYLKDSPWLNYLLKSKLRAEYIEAKELGVRYKGITAKEARGLAEEWMSTATVVHRRSNGNCVEDVKQLGKMVGIEIIEV